MGYIKKEFIDNLLDKVIIQDVIGDYVVLKRAGANLKGKSPFTDEKSGSFMVSPVKQIWKDFSSGKGGNVVKFLMEHKGKSYVEAIEILAEKYKETIQYENTEFAAKKAIITEKKEALRPVLIATQSQYFKAYQALPANHPARLEVEQNRKYNEDTILEWGIGFAPENFLYDLLKNSGRVKEGADLGLINSVYDKYSNRVVYPIHDGNGLIIGLAGRSITGKKEDAKWINPIVTDSNLLYNKSKVWFGIDKARTSIRKKNEAWIVEGYNDVIGWHINGIDNTVSPCGTAITIQQMIELKKICTKVILCLDPDDAGIRSSLKHIPEFIKLGFRVEIVALPLDPDDFTRAYQEPIDYIGLDIVLNHSAVRKDGFAFLLEHNLKGNELAVSDGAKRMCDLISKIEDDSMTEIYTGWLQKESKIKATTIKNWIKEAKAQIVEIVNDNHTQIELPKEVKIPIAELEKDIRRYGMFMANNQVYMSIGDGTDGRLRFSSMSNFMIEILQHMQDEKFPMKLLRIKNVYNEEKIFDTASENLNTPQGFDNTVTAHGNFRFDGNRASLLKLRTYLFDKMGNGRKIDVLGWQPDGRFFAWNNKITTETGEDLPMDDHGIFIKDKTYYYIPSANSIYKNNSFKFDSQKRFKVIKNTVPFEVFSAKVLAVHRDHGISAILFGLASLFQDIVVDKVAKFPILFFYGPGSTGKDELAEIVQSFVGIPQVAINLEGNVSTIKAQVREFAQFRNGISQLSEYKRGNSQLDGMLKSLWDRRGYKRGNIESHVGTDSVPIESSAILTGNDFPMEEPLILRLIWNEMTKNQFTEKEMQLFDELKDMMSKGVSGYSDDFIKYRPEFEKNFDKLQRNWKGILQDSFPEAKSRIIFNLSILATTYEVLKDKVIFPFTQAEMLQHFGKGIEQQIRKINASSIMNRFWEIFIASLRGHKDDRIQVNYIVSVESNLLYFNWTHVFAKIQRSWYSQYHEAAPSGSTVKEQIEKSGAFVESLKSHSFDSGREANRTSAIVVNLDQLSENVKNDIVGSIMFQLNQTEYNPNETNHPHQSNISFPPATPNEIKGVREISDEPF